MSLVLVGVLAVAGAAVAAWFLFLRSDAGQVHSFVSRPDLHPPTLEIDKSSRLQAPGDIFLAAKDGAGQSGPMILDPRGRLLWFQPMPSNRVAFDFREQQYQGRPVLTWWQGQVVGGHGANAEDIIEDTNYHVIARLHASPGLSPDLHEFELTSRGTALMTVYGQVHRNLTAFGGSAHGLVDDSMIEEVDIATGRVIYTWHSIDHVPLSDSYRKPPSDPTQAWDYFHINSIQENADGDFLVSGRHTNAVWKIDRKTGDVDWELGGRHSSFAMGPGASFVAQHDARWAPDGDVTLFDNAAPPTTSLRTRALRIHIDQATKTATLVHAYTRPKSLLSDSQGSVEILPNSNVFVGWGGHSPYFGEFTAGGRLLFDGRFVDGGADSYRSYRYVWNATPTDRPAIAFRTREPTGTTVYVSWNGATNVARWQVLAGPKPNRLHPRKRKRWEGFETRLKLPNTPRFVAVRALDANGRTIGQSVTRRVP